MFIKSAIEANIRIPIGVAVFFLGVSGIYGQNTKGKKDSLREKEIDEVVVVAYGKAKRSSYTGSVATVSGSKIETRPITNITKALEGQVPGLQAVSASG